MDTFPPTSNPSPLPTQRVLSPKPTLPASTPSPRAQEWGAVISIVIIVLMILVGAFYSWGKRISQEQQQRANIQQFESTTETE